MHLAQRNQIKGNKFAVYSDCEGAIPHAIDLHKEIRSKNMAIAGEHIQTLNASPSPLNTLAQAEMLDFGTWLPHAAKEYKISPDPTDYILKPFIIMPSDLPNRNGVSFPKEELLKWDIEAMRQRYRIWKGAPTHLEHNNQDPTIANGVVADCVVRPLKTNPNILKVVVLMALDRTRYPTLTQSVLKGDMNAVSMGAWVDHYTCSKCGREVGHCTHIARKGIGGIKVDADLDLVFAQVRGILPFEVSWVGTPAYSVAVNDDPLLSLT